MLPNKQKKCMEGSLKFYVKKTRVCQIELIIGPSCSDFASVSRCSSDGLKMLVNLQLFSIV